MAGPPDELLSQEMIYSLPDLYEIALKRSEEIKLSGESLYVAERNREKALSVLKPTLSAFGNYTRYSEEKAFGGALVQPEWTASWGLRVDQSFNLNGRERISVQAAEKNIRKSKSDFYAFTEGYLFDVASAYYDVLKATQAVEISRANVERLTKHRDAVSARLEIGEVSKTASYRADAELSQSDAELISSENTLRLTKVLLAQITGLPDIHDLSDPEKDNSVFSGDDLEHLKTFALLNRAEIRSLDIQKEIADDAVEISRSAYWPTLNAEGVYLRQDQGPSSPYDESLSVGLNFSFPIFDGGLRKADIRESLSQKRQADLAIASLSKQILFEVEQAYLEVLKFAKENYAAVAKQFQYGLANSVDVMDANTYGHDFCERHDEGTQPSPLSDNHAHHIITKIIVQTIRGQAPYNPHFSPRPDRRKESSDLQSPAPSPQPPPRRPGPSPKRGQ